MAKRNTSESEGTSNSSWESEEEQSVRNGNAVSKYEEQRLQRIAENRARLEAMGLLQMASSLKLKKVSPRIKKEVKDEDEEYIPEDDREGEPESSSSSEQDGRDIDLEKASGSRKRKAIALSLHDNAEASYCCAKDVGNISKAGKKGNIHVKEDKGRKMNTKSVKNKSVKMKGRVSVKNHESLEYPGGDDDDDEALRQDTAEASYCCAKNVGNFSKAGKKGNIHVKDDKGRKMNTKSFTSRLQMTEDEFIVHFFQLDEAGKGTVTKRDLERAALAHDFVWTDKELVDMIRCFDSDRDGKLSLDDFRKIVVRCNMIKESENS